MMRILSPAMILVLGAGYIGAKVAELALGRGEEVVLADNWRVTERADAEKLGAPVEDCDIREPADVARVLARHPDRVISLAAQAGRPESWRAPAYTEQTNLVGARIVADAVREAGRPPLTFRSSLHVYGSGPRGGVGAHAPYGPPGDPPHPSKNYPQLCFGVDGHHPRPPRAGLRPRARP